MNSSYARTPQGFRWRDTPHGSLLETDGLIPFADHGVTTRVLRFREPGIEGDYAKLAASFGVAPSSVIRVRQVHGNVVVVANAGDVISPDTEADAIICTDPNQVASVRVADCVPVLIADERREVVAAVHAGWRGTLAGATVTTIEMIRRLGIAPSRLVATIGPSVGPCCYQVSDEVRKVMALDWRVDTWFRPDGPEHWKLDLWTANREQLELTGVRPSAIFVAGLCTADHLDVFYSHRKEGDETGRMVAAIRSGVRSGPTLYVTR